MVGIKALCKMGEPGIRESGVANRIIGAFKVTKCVSPIRAEISAPNPSVLFAS